MKQGKLKIFFGYCAGVGKTYAMLEAAHERRREGMDVVIGYIEKHDRLDTIALMQGLECIALKAIMYHGITLEEFDLDQALQRHPQLILVDELAHTNVQGARHPKRYSDIQELLIYDCECTAFGKSAGCGCRYHQSTGTGAYSGCCI